MKGSRGMKKREKKIRQRKARQARIAVARRYYLTPKVWNEPCSHCSAASSIAYRVSGRRTACADCIRRLGIKARESRAWRDGGARAGSKVTVRHVDPEGLRSSPLPAVDPGPPREVDNAELIARLSGREGRHHGGGARRDALVTHSARKRPPGRPPPPHPLSAPGRRSADFPQ
jgi:hypothetical protein